MGDIMDEINELLGEEARDDVESEESGESGESEPRTESQSEYAESTESGEHTETGGADEAEGQESEESSEGEEEVKSEEDSQEGAENAGEESELERLRAEVNRLAAEAGEPAAENKPSEESSSSDDFDPIGEYDFDEIVESKETFSKWASDFAQKIQDAAYKKATADLNQQLQTQVSEQVSVHEQVRDFYQANPELDGVRDYVSKVAAQVSKENPESDFQTILDQTAQKARETLGIKKAEADAKSESKSKPSKKPAPAFADSTKAASKRKKSTGDGLSETEKQIQDLLEE